MGLAAADVAMFFLGVVACLVSLLAQFGSSTTFDKRPPQVCVPACVCSPAAFIKKVDLAFNKADTR